MIKWIGAILGYMYFRFGGAILGYFIGSLIDRVIFKKGRAQLGGFQSYSITKEAFELNLLSLFRFPVDLEKNPLSLKLQQTH